MDNLNTRKTLSDASLYIIIFIASILSYFLFLIFNYYFKFSVNYELVVYMLSVLGVFVALYIVSTWYILTGNIISLYTIFMLFFFLFNYGQPIMWAFGIHQIDEIGRINLYNFEKPTSSTIVYTQVLTLVSMIMFHLGAIFCYKPKEKHNKRSINISSWNLQLNFKSLLYTCIILSFIVIPVTFFNSISDLLYSQVHGYNALYYDDNRESIPLLSLIQYMFFPCLIGLLVGSKYNRKVKYFVYTIFTMYLIINLLSGDRGSWIIYLVILVFMSHSFHKRINWIKAIIYGVIGIIFMYIVNAIVSLRNTGIDLEGIQTALSVENNPIIRAFFEMGGSMKPALTLVQYGWDIWPYSNSYLNSIIGVFSAKIFDVFDIPFDTLSSWFSQNYLGISYGAGFSIIAESLINYGPILTPLFMIVMGYIIASLTFINKNNSLQHNPFKIFFTVSTMSAFITILRNHSHFVFKSWFFGVLVTFLLVLITKEIIKKNQYKIEES